MILPAFRTTNISPTCAWVNRVGSIRESIHVKNTAVGWKKRTTYSYSLINKTRGVHGPTGQGVIWDQKFLARGWYHPNIPAGRGPGVISYSGLSAQPKKGHQKKILRQYVAKTFFPVPKTFHHHPTLLGYQDIWTPPVHVWITPHLFKLAELSCKKRNCQQRAT